MRPLPMAPPRPAAPWFRFRWPQQPVPDSPAPAPDYGPGYRPIQPRGLIALNFPHWRVRFFQQQASHGGANRPPPVTADNRPGAGKALPLIERVPDPKDTRRMARFTEKVTDLLNSLIRQGVARQPEIGEWTLDIDGGQE